MAAADRGKATGEAWYLKSNFPVLFDDHDAFYLSKAEFSEFLKKTLDGKHSRLGVNEAQDTPTVAEAGAGLGNLDLGETLNKGKFLTQNGDVTFPSSLEALVDLFFELGDTATGSGIQPLIEAAWAEDSVATLRIIFNARSIHLGKSSRTAFYRCAGWLAQNHPQTLIANLQWLSRPVIEKKLPSQEKGEGSKACNEAETKTNADNTADGDENTEHFDVRNGVAHGYWKDLLNLLALSANNNLDLFADPKDVLNITLEKDLLAKSRIQGRRDKNASETEYLTYMKEKRRCSETTLEENRAKHIERMQSLDPEYARSKRRDLRQQRHDNAKTLFEKDTVHRCLHIAVTRLFADQLKSDLALLHDGSVAARKQISLCAKWAPSNQGFHDKHTFIVSSIAELMYSSERNTERSAADTGREGHLRWARDAYRRDVAALRAHLGIIERDLSANTLGNIKYERVPSIAMNIYTPIFVRKDGKRFEDFIEKVAEGKADISGATLLPSTLIHTIQTSGTSSGKKRGVSQAVLKKIGEMKVRVANEQWRTLVQRVKDSGVLDSSLAVCDVSGSMNSPTLSDGTRPIDSAIGLSILLSEVASPPFRGRFITFSEEPSAHTFDVSLSLSEKCEILADSPWGMNTDFVAVFEKLILPLAKEKKLKPEEMVKRVFVFSDMQFDSAEIGEQRWTTSYERITKNFADAGYAMPELVFWNLAAIDHEHESETESTYEMQPKPVLAQQEGTALVSGYSQGMLKMFMDNGSLEDPEPADNAEAEDADATTSKKRALDPNNAVQRAVSNRAYKMLKVVD